MNKSYLTIALTLTVLFGASLSARAGDFDSVVVNVPFEFVAGAGTLPAGTYTVGRPTPGANSVLSISSYDHSAFLLPIDADSVRNGPPKLSFEHVGGRYFLSKVETTQHVYNLGASPEMIKLGQMRDNGTAASAGGN
ncbi:MAG TPA: hypothetical protein VI386_10425 [Candidatus Sulfotelmatobacter sp.]